MAIVPTVPVVSTSYTTFCCIPPSGSKSLPRTDPLPNVMVAGSIGLFPCMKAKASLKATGASFTGFTVTVTVADIMDVSRPSVML